MGRYHHISWHILCTIKNVSVIIDHEAREIIRLVCLSVCLSATVGNIPQCTHVNLCTQGFMCMLDYPGSQELWDNWVVEAWGPCPLERHNIYYNKAIEGRDYASFTKILQQSKQVTKGKRQPQCWQFYNLYAIDYYSMPRAWEDIQNWGNDHAL